MTISFFVPGLARPKGSKRSIPIYRGKKGQPREFTGKTVLVESAGAGLKAWEGQIRGAAAKAFAALVHRKATSSLVKSKTGTTLPLGLFDGPLAVSLTFTLLKPKSAPKSRVIYPIKRPDVDKLARSCLDAMTKIVWRDDSQVIKLTAEKTYGDPPGVSITVQTV